MCYPERIRSKFSKESFSFTNTDAAGLWSKLKTVISEFRGDAEKYYSGFYSLLVYDILEAKFQDRFLSNTLLTEVANDLLGHLSGSRVRPQEDAQKPSPLSDKER